MINYIFVMLIWAGGGNGGPATITGFSSMQACENAIVEMKNNRPIIHQAWYYDHYYKCIQLKRD